jgi:hypothetical protein
MHIKGKLMEPSLSFNIDLPSNKIYPMAADQIDLVEARLSQLRSDTSEMNKQVFAVLILGRFVADDPFSSAAAQSLGFSAIQSLSSFVSDEMNKAAGRLALGFDLTADLATTEDYTTGALRERTSLNVAASKKVLRDRLKLTVGSDFEVAGPQPNYGRSTGIPSNLAVDYQLSRDGKYSMRVYHRDYYAGVLLGAVSENGVNFILSTDYNRFKNIFMRRKRHRQYSGKSENGLPNSTRGSQ